MLPRELSNGQKQRTALARALVARAAVLLLDDPLRNVDAKLRYEMRLELPRLLRALRRHRPLRHAGLQGGDGARRPHRACCSDGRFVPGRHAGRDLRAARATSRIARLFGDPTDQPLTSSTARRRTAASRIAGTAIRRRRPPVPAGKPCLARAPAGGCRGPFEPAEDAIPVDARGGDAAQRAHRDAAARRRRHRDPGSRAAGPGRRPGPRPAPAPVPGRTWPVRCSSTARAAPRLPAATA